MTGQDVLALDGVAQRYAWGSTEAIPRLLGERPDGRPLAELWFGAHPGGPSPVPALGAALDAVVGADPLAMLGAGVVERFGPRLPFLLKLLAAERPLSIQVHPNLAQARAGFAAEDAAGIERDAAGRNYRDANHKPELLCALTAFDALCGFRPAARTVRLLDALGMATLAPVRDLLAAGDLRAAFGRLLHVDDPAALAHLVAAAVGALDGGEWALTAEAVRAAVAAFPGDVGVALVLLLNAVHLEPGQAIYIPPGTVHAYLHGTGVEIMASSDNVLRCGLTPKHIDVDELLQITDFGAMRDPRFAAEHVGEQHDYRPPVADFALHNVDLDACHEAGPYPSGPHVVLCVSGATTVVTATTSVALSPGRAAFVPARGDGFTLRGTGQAFVAATGC